jgi:hypothetical protein
MLLLPRQEDARMDVIYLGLGVAFFGLSWGLIVVCDHLS